MGFWNELFKGLETPANHNPATTGTFAKLYETEDNFSEPILSEPVLSIIQTLKNGEWSYRVTNLPYLEQIDSGSIYFTHEWFGSHLYIWVHNCQAVCKEEWMTQDEKEAVGSVCWQIYQGRVKWEKEQSLAKQRESFMCLVKEEQ